MHLSTIRNTKFHLTNLQNTWPETEQISEGKVDAHEMPFHTTMYALLRGKQTDDQSLVCWALHTLHWRHGT